MRRKSGSEQTRIVPAPNLDGTNNEPLQYQKQTKS